MLNVTIVQQGLKLRDSPGMIHTRPYWRVLCYCGY